MSADFDWPRFFERYHIDYSTSGPNTSAGNAVIHCPWCGVADHGQHLSVSLQGRGYSCWRNHEHRGKNPARLIQMLINCSRDEAHRLAGRSDAPPASAEADFGAHVASLLGAHDKQPIAATKALSFPKEVQPLLPRSADGLFAKYLLGRGYTAADLPPLIERYHLRYALTGPFHHRLILPVYGREGLVNWTGRLVGPGNPRYKTLSTDSEKAKASNLPVGRRSIEACLWQEDQLREGGEALILCEGPFDAMRVDYFVFRRYWRATCLFGSNLSIAQLTLLTTLVPRFRLRGLMLDPDAWAKRLPMLDRLLPLGFTPLFVPEGCKDPAEMTKQQVERLRFSPEI